MEAVLTAVGEVITLGGTLLTKVIEDPVLVWFFAAGFISVGAGAIGTLIGLAKR